MQRTIHDAIRSAPASARQKDATIATDNPVRVYDSRSGRIIDEVLLIDGANWRDPAPLQVDHDRGIPSMVGSVVNFRKESGRLVGRLRFAEGVQQAEEAWLLVRDGHLTSVSIGYSIDDSEEIPAGQSRTIGGRTFVAKNGPLRIVKRWTVREVSLVTVPADAAATIRSSVSDRSLSTMSRNVLDVIGPAHRSMTLPQIWAAEARYGGRHVPSDEREIVQRAMETGSTALDLAGLVNTSILTGFRAAPDSTAGWVRTVPLPNFLAAKIAAVKTAPVMKRLASGQTAVSTGFSVTAEGWALARFAASFELDEQDLLNSPFDMIAIAVEEMGAQARRLVPDLVYSVLLNNAAMADGVAIFDAAGRSNLGTPVLAAAGLKTGIGAVGNQVLTDVDGNPVHRNLMPRFLLVPPELFGTGKEIVRGMQTGENDFIVRAESRLGTAGVVNPMNDSVVAGTATNWLLTCPSDQAAGVVVGSLNGKMEPSIRTYSLDQGQWGMGVDIIFDLAATALTPEALYWSTGTVA